VEDRRRQNRSRSFQTFWKAGDRLPMPIGGAFFLPFSENGYEVLQVGFGYRLV
jgi:hypothetical protein